MKIHNHTLPKAIRRHSIHRWLATAKTMTAMLTTLATLTGCSADNDPAPSAGDASFTFGATIASRKTHGTAPASRAITDGTFEEGDQIFVHIDGKRKVFVYRTARGFVHDPSRTGLSIDPATPNWENGAAEKDLLAYGPMSQILSATGQGYIYRNVVAVDQRADIDYQESDYVYAAQTLRRSNPALTFRHGMARIVLRLRSGGPLTEEEVAGTTVLLGDQNLYRMADIDPQTGTLTANGIISPVTVIPHRCADTPAGFAAAYEALLPPQDVSGKPFIIVRLANGKELGYAAENGSILKGGYEYVYNVTIGHNTITVSPAAVGEWGYGDSKDIPSTPI